MQLRANQMETVDDLALKVQQGQLNTREALQQYSSDGMVSRDQARTNVVLEILHAEREYVKHLRDVVEVSDL